MIENTSLDPPKIDSGPTTSGGRAIPSLRNAALELPDSLNAGFSFLRTASRER